MRVNKAERQNLRRVAAGGALDRMAGEGSFHRDPPPRRALGGGPHRGDSGRSPAFAFPTPAAALARKKKKKNPDSIAEFCQIRKIYKNRRSAGASYKKGFVHRFS